MESPELDFSTLPWPGEELVQRVSERVDRENFYQSGKNSLTDLDHALGLVHRNLGTYTQILDFGCGCGRSLIWMKHLTPSARLCGTDIDSRAIAWAQENIAWATFTVNQPLPPLAYPDGTFDLVFASSVFTHIDENYQDQWLAELRRVTKPGGHLLLSLHGEKIVDAVQATAVSEASPVANLRRELSEKGMFFMRDDGFVGGPFPDFYHSAFHAPWYIFQHWGRYFTVRAYIHQGWAGYQDLVFLERQADEIALNPIEAAPAPGGVSTSLPQESAPDDAFRSIPTAGRLHPQLAKALRRAARYLLDIDPGGPPRALESSLLESPVLNEKLDRAFILISRQGDRINRLEAELLEAVKRTTPGESGPK